MVAPPPIPSKPKPFSSSGPPTFSKPPYSTGTFPGKVRPVGGQLKAAGVLSSHSHTLPLPNKQESPPAAAIRPYTPDISEAPQPVLQKPQTLAASSIYSMYTQQATPGKGYQPSGGTLPRSQPRGDALIQLLLLLLLLVLLLCALMCLFAPSQFMGNQSSKRAEDISLQPQTAVQILVVL